MSGDLRTLNTFLRGCVKLGALGDAEDDGGPGVERAMTGEGIFLLYILCVYAYYSSIYIYIHLIMYNYT